MKKSTGPLTPEQELNEWSSRALRIVILQVHAVDPLDSHWRLVRSTEREESIRQFWKGVPGEEARCHEKNALARAASSRFVRYLGY